MTSIVTVNDELIKNYIIDLMQMSTKELKDWIVKEYYQQMV